MTKNEKLVLTAYTGILMCDFSEFHEYAEKLLGRPVQSLEMATNSFWEAMKEKTKDEFMKIIGDDTNESE